MPSKPSLNVFAFEERLVPDATALDLTAHGSSGWVGEAYFTQYDARPTGTGYIESFLRVQGASSKGVTQQGYNTDTRPLQFDENKSPQFTRTLMASELPSVNIGGTMYKEFLLDINQKSSQPLLSLDQLRIYSSASSNLYGYDAAAHTLGGEAPVYDLDAGGDNTVTLDYRLNTGSGAGDMLLYVPAAAFAGGEYVYLYSKFGEYYASNAGFQEWAHGTSALTTNVGTICGEVFTDTNANGSQDEGELGIPDRIVYIDANNNAELDENETYTITDENGHYEFADLVAEGAYHIRTILEDGTSSFALDVFVDPFDHDCDNDFGLGRPPT